MCRSNVLRGRCYAMLWLAVVAAGAAAGIAMAAAGTVVTITGAGATFPYPLYSRWFAEYRKVDSGVRFNYQSIGSGGGIRQVVAGTVDFGATDAPMTEAELAKAPGKLVHIPTVAGAVVVTYNLPGVGKGLRLTGGALADIFLGRIGRWDDPRLARANPEARLPAADIVVVHRSDGSGTTNIFTEYLAAVSAEWRRRVGHGKSVRWPVGLGGKGNEGVAGQVRNARGAIGYVELAYAAQSGLPYAAIENREGKFVLPSLAATSAAAAAAAPHMPADFRVSLVNQPGKASYPIAGFTWILLYAEQRHCTRGRKLVEFLWWATHEGQGYARRLLYAPLPQPVVRKVEAALRAISCGGEPLLGSAGARR